MDKKQKITLKSCCLVLCIAEASLHQSIANDDFFSDVTVTPVAESSQLTEGVTGWFKQAISYGYQAPAAPFSRTAKGFNTIPSSVQLQLDRALTQNISYRIAFRAVHDFAYSLNNDLQPSLEELSELESRIEIRDIYLDSKINEGLYLRLGNQLIALGESENLAITDLVSARDLRTYGQADLEDIRQAIPAAKLTYLSDDMTYEFVTTYKAGYNWLAPERNEFDPFIRLRTDELTLNDTSPENNFEYLLRVNKSFNSGEINVVIADVNNNELSMKNAVVTAEGTELNYSQDRFQALGLFGSYASGLWVWRSEIATHFDKALSPSESYFFTKLDGWDETNQFLSMVGFDYSGFGNSVITAELDYVRTFGSVEMLSVDKDQLGFNLRWYWQDPNALLTLQADFSQMLGNNGNVLRLTSDYELTQHINIGGMLVSYSADKEKQFLYDYRNNDVAQVYFKYSF